MIKNKIFLLLEYIHILMLTDIWTLSTWWRTIYTEDGRIFSDTIAHCMQELTNQANKLSWIKWVFNDLFNSKVWCLYHRTCLYNVSKNRKHSKGSIHFSWM